MTRNAWLSERQSGIGGTDIASIAGVGFLTPEQVYEEKVAEEPIDRPPTEVMRMGIALEAHNAALYQERTGATLHDVGLLRSQVTPWLFATTDRVQLINRVPVELKYSAMVGDEWGDEGTDQVPDKYICQTTWHVAVLRDLGATADHADLSLLDAWGNHRIFVIPYDPKLAEILLDLGASFWARVQLRNGLEGWHSPALKAVQDRLAKIRPDTAVQLDEAAAEDVNTYLAFKECEKANRRLADEYKERLIDKLGDNELGILPDGRRVRQREVHRKAYAVEASTYRDFRILAPKKVITNDQNAAAKHSDSPSREIE